MMSQSGSHIASREHQRNGLPQCWFERRVPPTHLPNSPRQWCRAMQNSPSLAHNRTYSEMVCDCTRRMELLAKLFYLEDLQHEIQERSTAVDHSVLQNTLLLAIGDAAVVEGRAA